jgi:signal transduction histidine kinase/ligand-binding sensor domain-containing protein
MPAQNIIPRFENIGVNDGLSQSSVYSVYQDKKGFMWFGTADGLNRYDGQNIRIYKINDKKIANSNFIHGNICEDSRGNIWFCNETGLFYYDPLTDKLTRKLVFKKYGWTAGIFIDDKDIFYIFDPGSGIFGYHIQTKQLVLTACRLQKPYFNFIAEELTTNCKNTIWLKAQDGTGVFALNTHNGKLTFNRSVIKFYATFYAGNGKLYNLDAPGKLTITDTTFRVLDTISYQIPANKTLDVQAICRDAYHRVWISTYDNGLVCYDESTRTFTDYLHDNSKLKTLPINIISVLCIDRSGNLWIGTDGGGVCKLDLKPPKFNLFPLNEGDYPLLKDYFIKCFYEEKNGQIWFGTHSSGLNVYDPTTRNIKSYNYQVYRSKGLPGPIVSSIFKDRVGQMWIAASLGIAIFSEKTGVFEPVKIASGLMLNEHTNFIYKLIQLDNGEIVAGTIGGLMTIKKTGATYTGTFGRPKMENNILITDVVEMTDHTLWASSPLHGLIHYKKAGDDFTAIEKRFPLIDLRSIHQDEQDKNILWICTGIGLIKFNTLTEKQIVYDERNGMTNSYIYGVLEDEQRNFWMSTNMGIIFFDRTAGTFQNYTAKDGLQSNEFNTQAFYKGPSGNMYFGGIKGFNWFNPKTIKADAATLPGVAITSIGVDDKPYVKDDLFAKNKTIELNYDENNISFQFAALDFTKPQANKVKFILEAWDKDWITSEDKNMRYTHLIPGHYRLRVKAANSDGVWSKEEKLTIIVNAPFWQKTWFYICTTLVFLAIIIYITFFISQQKIKKRLRQLEKQAAIDAERNRISRDMHDEIGSGLTHIALLSELIQTQQKTERAIKNDLGNISAAARKLVESMSEIIWALNPQNDSLENLLSYIREQMQQFFEPFEIALTVDFPDEVPLIKLSNEQRRNLYLVTKEALNNVMKHANASKVKLSMRVDKGIIAFEVTDNGNGMQCSTDRKAGNGLKNMRKRMEDIGGAIEWVDQEKGVKVVYTLDVD